MGFFPAVASAGMQAIGSIQAGNAAADAANYQAQVARNNEIIAKQNADYAIAAGNAQAEAEGLKVADRHGRIKASMAANGVDVNTGSAVDVLTSDREVGKLETQNVLNNALLKAYGYRAQASNFQAQANLDSMQARNKRIGGLLSAGGGLLSSASSLPFSKAFESAFGGD